MPGMLLMSSGERRTKRNRSQIAAQIARQDIDAVRNDAFTIFLGLMPNDTGVHLRGEAPSGATPSWAAARANSRASRSETTGSTPAYPATPIN